MNVLALFDTLHPGPTWKPWRAFVASVYGEPMDEADLALFRAHTGRQEPRAGGYPEGVAIAGVQSGKTRVAGTLEDHAALTGVPGTHALGVAQDQRGSVRALLRYAREPFEQHAAFRAEVSRDTADSLELRRGTSLSAYPCRPAALRGLRASIVCIDELAFFTATDGRPVDTEMLRVARGRVATTSGKVIVLSSPYGQSGALWDLHRKHYGREDSPTLVWQASAPEMNPTLPADYLARMEADDPEAFRSEVLGEFRAGLSTLFEPDALDACVEAGVRERAPQSGTSYLAFADAASGTGKDSFAVAVAHKDGERAALDAVRAWKPPFNPSGVIAEASDLLRDYGVREVTGDRYAPGFVSEHFRVHGIKYVFSEQDRSALYLGLLPYVNARSVVLIEQPELLRELRGLERRRGTSGRDKVDHRAGSHDDRANAAAGALVSAAARKEKPLRGGVIAVGRGRGGDPGWVLSDDDDGEDAMLRACVVAGRLAMGYEASTGKRVLFKMTDAWGEKIYVARDKLDEAQARVLYAAGRLRPDDIAALAKRGIEF